MKKILAINYSQTGQLSEIVDNITKGIDSNLFSIHRVNYTPKENFHFPWNRKSFFDAMPECVLEKGCDIEGIDILNEKYDLIILGFQPWFLSPSIPTIGLFKNEKFQKILSGTDVITVIGSRNMWINSFFDVKKHIEKFNGKIIGNIPFSDKNSNLISAVTIVYWMLKGKKDKLFNIFPVPGISNEDINSSEKFGHVISNCLSNDKMQELQKEIIKVGKISIKWNILFIEKRAKKLFQIWANLIISKSTTVEKRKKWIKLFSYYLIFALFIVSPIILTIYFMLFRFLFLKKEIRTQRQILLNFQKW